MPIHQCICVHIYTHAYHAYICLYIYTYIHTQGDYITELKTQSWHLRVHTQLWLKDVLFYITMIQKSRDILSNDFFLTKWYTMPLDRSLLVALWRSETSNNILYPLELGGIQKQLSKWSLHIYASKNKELHDLELNHTFQGNVVEIKAVSIACAQLFIVIIVFNSIFWKNNVHFI